MIGAVRAEGLSNMSNSIYNFNKSSTVIDKYSDLITADNYIYLYHLPSDKTGEGTYVYLPQWPGQISDTINSSFSETNALSRSAPIFSYKNSGPRSMQISVELHRDMMDEANKHISNLPLEDREDYVDGIIKALQAVALPNYHSESKEVEPPMVAVRFGDEIFIKGVVNSGVTVEYKKPLLTNNKYACVNITFTVSEIDPMDAVSISKVGSFRNISKSFKALTGGNS